MPKQQLEFNFVRDITKETPNDIKEMDEIAKEARVTFEDLMDKYRVTEIDKKAIHISCMWMV